MTALQEFESSLLFALTWVPESDPHGLLESGLIGALEGDRDEPETLYT
jgi:hypothetical protein